jgi:hypothetical protein
MRLRGNSIKAVGDDHLATKTYTPNFHSFGQAPLTGGTHISHITQVTNKGMAEKKWTQFIIRNSETPTSAGLVRINQSIRTYCWSILSAQYETRKPLMGVEGKAGGARQRFVELMEDACIERGGIEFSATTGSGTTQLDYERALELAKSKLDFSVGEELYLIPGDMNLHDLSGGYNGYSNQLKIASSTLGLGSHTRVNVERASTAQKNAASDTPTPTPKPVPRAPTTKRPETPASDVMKS